MSLEYSEDYTASHESLRSQLEDVLHQELHNESMNEDSVLLEKSKLTLERLKSEFKKLALMQFQELSSSRKKLESTDRQVPAR